MMKSISKAFGLAAVVTALVMTSAVQASGRGGGGGGHSGGGHVGGGASFAAHAGGGGAAFSARSGGARFIASAGPARVGAVNRANFVRRDRDRDGDGRHHRRGYYAGYGGYAVYAAGYGGYGGYGGYDYDVPVVGYGYFNSYDRCRSLRARYKETGLRKWRIRYEACRNGDDD